jgi:magnesium and cobalt transporter
VNNEPTAPVAGTETPDPAEPPQHRNFLSRLFGRGPEVPHDAAETAGTESGSASPAAEEHLIANLRVVGEQRVEDFCIPRADIQAMPDDLSFDGVVAAFRKSGMTRMPVYSETIDTPLGFIHLKDLALEFGFGKPTKDFRLDSLLRKLLFVPPSMKLSVLLRKMQATRIHLAFVIDEFGGVEGLVSIEDLLEQIVGDIADEHDEQAAALWTQERPGVFLAQARADLAEFEKAAGVDLLPDHQDDDIDTLGGLAFLLAGRIPKKGETIPHPAGHEIEVVEADARKVKRLRLRLKSEPAGA